MTRTTTTTLHGGRAFIVIHRLGTGWHSGFGWEVHEALPIGQHIGSGRRYSVGPILHRGTSPFRILARYAARCHADRVQL